MHKVYSYSDSDDDYATSPKIPPTIETPASSRSQPRSRVSPQPHVEDKQLQHLEINSDDSFPEDNPYVMPDDDDISDVEMSFDKKLTRNVDDEVQATSNQSKINQSENKNKSIQNLGKVKNITDEEDASSDEETANAMVRCQLFLSKYLRLFLSYIEHEVHTLRPSSHPVYMLNAIGSSCESNPSRRIF